MQSSQEKSTAFSTLFLWSFGLQDECQEKVTSLYSAKHRGKKRKKDQSQRHALNILLCSESISAETTSQELWNYKAFWGLACKWAGLYLEQSEKRINYILCNPAEVWIFPIDFTAPNLFKGILEVLLRKRRKKKKKYIYIYRGHLQS